MTHQRNDPPGANPAGLADSRSWQGDEARHSPKQSNQQDPSDHAMLAGYSLVLSDIESNCRQVALELNRAANDLQNFDEDRAIAEFWRAAKIVRATGRLIIDLRNGGL